MGVGVYDSDFHGSGKTFLVDGAIESDEDFEAACASAIDEGADPPTRSEFSQDFYNDFNQDLLTQVEEALTLMGFDVEERGYMQFNSKNRAPFDNEFVALGTCESVCVGWRSWESDFVIGIAPAQGWVDELGDPKAYEDEIKERTGRDADKVHNAHIHAAEAVKDALIAHLSSMALECRYKTSGYTTAAYSNSTEQEADLKIKTACKALGSLKSWLRPFRAPSMG